MKKHKELKTLDQFSRYSLPRVLYLTNGLSSMQEYKFRSHSLYEEKEIYGFFFYCLKRFRRLNYEE